jgi:hypothetical protein
MSLQLILEALELLLKLQKSKIENENVAIKHSWWNQMLWMFF